MQRCVSVHAMTSVSLTSKCLHLLLDALVHAEVKHQLYILLCVLHGHHLQKNSKQLKIHIHPHVP